MSSRSPSYDALRIRLRDQASIAAYGVDQSSFGSGAAGSEVNVTYVWGDYFGVLGVRLVRGRYFTTDELADGQRTPALISEQFWKTAFGAREDVLGRTIVVAGTHMAVVGIVAAEFRGSGLQPNDVWLSGHVREANRADLRAVGSRPYDLRLWILTRVPNVALTGAVERAATDALRNLNVIRDSAATVALVRVGRILDPQTSSRASTILTQLYLATAIILFLAAANVTSLLLIRAARRRREFAVRQALGSTTRRLIQQLLIEAILLAGLSGAIAVIIAIGLGALLRNLLVPGVQWTIGMASIGVVIAVISGAIAVGVLIAIAPSLAFARLDSTQAFRSAGVVETKRSSRMRSGLIVAQAALSLLVVAAAVTCVRSLQRLVQTDLGFQPKGVIVASLSRRLDEDAGQDLALAFGDLKARVEGMPAVRDVALVFAPPVQNEIKTKIFLPGTDSLVAMIDDLPGLGVVSAETFRVLGIPVLAGRPFRPGGRRAGHDRQRAGGESVLAWPVCHRPLPDCRWAKRTLSPRRRSRRRCSRHRYRSIADARCLPALGPSRHPLWSAA